MTTRRDFLFRAAAAGITPSLVLTLSAQARAALAPADQAVVRQAEDYLNGIKTLQARFVQISSNGNFSAGEVFIRRPGRLRFEYDPPVPIVMIADGINLLYYDRELKQSTFIPLWETPLWFLIRDEVNLEKKVQVSEVVRDSATVRLTVSDTETPESGSVTLVFTERPFALRKWVVTDAQGITTQVTLQNPEYGLSLPDKIFDTGELDPYGFRGGNQ